MSLESNGLSLDQLAEYQRDCRELEIPFVRQWQFVQRAGFSELPLNREQLKHGSASVWGIWDMLGVREQYCRAEQGDNYYLVSVRK